MTKKVKILLISVLFLIATVCVSVFAGCKVKYTVDELKEKYNLTAQITYFLNSDGGSFNGSYVKNLYYKDGAMPMDLGNSAMISGSSEMTIKKGNNFTGWYYVETDRDGNPLYAKKEGEEQKVYSESDNYDVTKGMSMSMTEDEFDFSKPVAAGEHIYLCGDFYGDVKLELHLLCDGLDDTSFNKIQFFDDNGETVTVNDGEEIEYGSAYIPKAGTGLTNYSSALQDKLSNYTVVDFYQKNETTGEYTPFTGWPIKYPEPDAEGNYNNVVLYLKVLDGKWQVINSYTDLSLMFALGDCEERYYLKQDINCEGELAVRSQNSFSGQFYGNGYSIKNLTVQSLGNSSLATGTSASVFGTITSTAVIKNVTFENLTVNFIVRTNGDPNISFIANRIEDDATLQGVKISGSLNVDSTSSQNLTSISASNWLFGDKDDATYKDINVTAATCTISLVGGTKTVYTVGNNN